MALQILVYYDDVEICDPLGSRAKHKLGTNLCDTSHASTVNAFFSWELIIASIMSDLLMLKLHLSILSAITKLSCNLAVGLCNILLSRLATVLRFLKSSGCHGAADTQLQAKEGSCSIHHLAKLNSRKIALST